MHWVLRLVTQAVVGGIAGGIASVVYYRRQQQRANPPQNDGTRIVRRLGKAPSWTAIAVGNLGNGSHLDTETADTVGQLRPNQGRFLVLREYDLVSGSSYVDIPTAARLTDDHTDVFIFCDSAGGYHIFTLGAKVPELSPADLRGGWVRAKMEIIDTPPTPL